MAKVSTMILLAVIMAIALGVEATEPFSGTSQIMKYDDEHIGGKETGPVNIFPTGNEDLVRERIGIGRVILGELKKQTQLYGLPVGKTRIIRLEDGTLIQAKTIFGDDGKADIDQLHIDVTRVKENPIIHDKCLGFIARVIAKNTYVSSGITLSKSVNIEVVEPDDDVYYGGSGIGSGQLRPLYQTSNEGAHSISGDYSPKDDYYVNTYGDWDFNTDPSQDTFEFYGEEITRPSQFPEAIMPFRARQRYSPNVRMIGANYFFNNGQIVLGATNDLLSLMSSESGYSISKDKAYNPNLTYTPHRMQTAIAVGLTTARYRSTYNYQSWGTFPMSWKMTAPMPKGDYEVIFSVDAPGEEASIDIWFPDSRILPFKATLIGSSTANNSNAGGGYLAEKRYFIHVGKEVEWHEGMKNPYVTVKDR